MRKLKDSKTFHWIKPGEIVYKFEEGEVLTYTTESYSMQSGYHNYMVKLKNTVTGETMYLDYDKADNYFLNVTNCDAYGYLVDYYLSKDDCIHAKEYCKDLMNCIYEDKLYETYSE